jgi:NADPH:quinone reductase-like Zn-dependent oxidoreductase
VNCFSSDVRQQSRRLPADLALIHGAAGGVGTFAVQFARWRGAHVSATATLGDTGFLRALEAERVSDDRTARFEKVLPEVDMSNRRTACQWEC